MPQKKNNSNNSEKPQNVYFLSLELENVRCFSEKQKIDFSDGNDKPRQWTIILGDNGTGKTTILQALIALIPEIQIDDFTRQQLVPNFFPARNSLVEKWRITRNVEYKVPSSGWKNDEYQIITTIILSKNLHDFSDSKKIAELNLVEDEKGRRGTKVIFFEGKLYANCFAYGASRKAGETSLSEQDKDNAYKTLFDETALLINPEEWLLQADYALKRDLGFSSKRIRELELVIEILKKILPDIDNVRSSEKENGGRILKPIVEFHTPYGWVEAKDLSLGYRTSMAWMVDFASRMFDLYPESENPLAEPAVVLIDEIDLHLHPKWQRELLDYLSNLFPNTQFIVTTHSPLIVQSAAARDANIVVCRREGDHVVIDQSVEAVKNWRADQILTSDLFGLETTRPKETGKLLKEKEEILSKAKLTKKDEKRLVELDEEIGFLPVSENQEDNEAMEIIRNAADWIKTQAK